MPTVTRPSTFTIGQFEDFDPQPHGNGAEKRFLCSVCGDSKPRNTAHRSMAVNTESGLYNCHRCHTKGKLQDFWQEGKSPQRSRANRALKKAFELNTGQSTLSDSQYDWREFAAGAKPLNGTPGAEYLESRGIPFEVLPHIARGCLYHPLYFFAQRPAVLFTFYDRDGVPVATSARFIDGKPKPHQTLGPKKLGAFYTMPEVWSAPVIVLVEAPIDALTLMACGVPAVALGGCEWPAWLPRACGLKNVVLAFDNDEAGDKAAERLAPELEALGAKTARLKPKGAKDWNAMLQELDIDSLSRRLYARLRHAAYFTFGMEATVKPSDWWTFALHVVI